MKKFSKFSFGYIIWMCVLILIPLGIMVYLSLLDIKGLNFDSSSFTLSNFATIFSSTNIAATKLSLKFSLISTVICFVIGYPIAYILSNCKWKYKFMIIVLFMLPLWTNLLVRVETIRKLFDKYSILNAIGISFDLSGSHFVIIFSMVMVYLPFMIFPIYTVLEKRDKALVEAAYDLGANPIKTFFKVTFPLSIKGVVSGVTMVFLPCALGFAISDVAGDSLYTVIGNVIEQNFLVTHTYNIGSALSLVMIIFIFGFMLLLNKVDKDGETLL